MALLKAGAETDKKDVDGYLPLDMAPGPDVRPLFIHIPAPLPHTSSP
jgi:hypothetical protein